MLKCETCGRRMDDEDVFCSECRTERKSSVNGKTSELSNQRSNEDDSLKTGPCLGVQWNKGRGFVEEATLSFNLRLAPDANLSHVEILIASDAGKIKQLHKEVGFVPGGAEKQVDIPFHAPQGSVGEIPFDIYLRYEEKGRVCTFCAAQKHHIYKTEQVPQAVHYHSTTNVTSGDGHANDQHVNVSGAAMPAEKEKKALWEEINTRELWEPLDLYETDSFPLRPEEPAAPISEQAVEEKAGSLPMKWIVLGLVAVGVFALLLVLSGQGGKTAPVQVNVIQQSGSGTHVAQISSPAKPPQAQPDRSVSPARTPVPPETAVKQTGEDMREDLSTEPLPGKQDASASAASAGLTVEFGLVGGRTEWVEGEKLQYHIRSNRDCHIALFCLQPDGTTVVLFPNRWNPDSFVRGGTELFVPDTSSGFEIVVSPPFGQDTVELIACIGRTEFHTMLSGRAAQTTRGMPFVVETDGGLTRGMSVVPKAGASAEWYRETIMVRTGKSR